MENIYPVAVKRSYTVFPKRMVCYSWQWQRFCQYCPSNWYGIQHQSFRLQPMNLIILQCFYWNRSHPENGNQSDGRTETIDSNIFKSSLSNLLFWNPANQTSGTIQWNLNLFVVILATASCLQWIKSLENFTRDFTFATIVNSLHWSFSTVNVQPNNIFFTVFV